MAKVETKVNAENQMFTDYDVSQLLLGNNSFVSGTFAAYGTDMVIDPGTVVARLTTTGEFVPLDTSATDGTQYPVGLLIKQLTVADGGKADTQIVNKGKINENLIRFWNSGQGLDTIVDNRSIFDWLNDIGFEIEGSDELTKVDNS